MDKSHEPPPGANNSTSALPPSPPDWTDEGFRRQFFGELREKLDDMNGSARDMLRSPEQRELGPVKHRELYEDAAASAAEMIAYALGEAAPAPRPRREREELSPARRREIYEEAKRAIEELLAEQAPPKDG